MGIERFTFHFSVLGSIRRYRDEELELGEVVNFQIPVTLDAGRRWLEAGQKLVGRTSRVVVLQYSRGDPEILTRCRGHVHGLVLASSRIDGLTYARK